jgi:transforming growth factor-beta-induced protein
MRKDLARAPIHKQGSNAHQQSHRPQDPLRFHSFLHSLTIMMLPVVSKLVAVAAVSLQVTAIMAAPSRRLQGSTAAQSIVELVTSDPDLTKLAGALSLPSNADLLNTLSTGKDFTVLAPTDAAFDALALTTVGMRVLTKAGYASHLFDLLGLHVNVGTVVYAADLVTGGSFPMANGEMVTVGDGPTFAGPSNNETAPATVTTPDILASNGVIHKIDTVLLPAFWILDAVTLAETSEEESVSTLKDLFLKVKDDPTNSAILSTAKSVEVTIFAPTDEAFTALGAKAIATILGNPTLLFNILQNHVTLAGVLGIDDLTDGLSIATLRNSPLIVSRDGDKVMLGESLVTDSILVRSMCRRRGLFF